jgi:hypothetical protein
MTGKWRIAILGLPAAVLKAGEALSRRWRGPRRTLVRLRTAIALLGIAGFPHHRAQAGSLSSDLHWYVDGAYGTTVDGSVLKGGSKNLRAVSTFNYAKPEDVTFGIYRYQYWFTDANVTNFRVAALTPPPPNATVAYQAVQAWALPASNNYYYFYDKIDGNFAGYSPYVESSNTAAAIEVSQVKFNIGAQGTTKGIAEIGANGSRDSTTVTVKVTVDPSVQLAVVFPRSESDTINGGALDTSSPGFGATQWQNALNNFSTAPSGWSFSLSNSSLPDLQSSASVDLNVSAASSDLGQTVPFEILAKLTLPDGTVQYTNTPTVAYSAVPEPTSWVLLGVGALEAIGYVWRHRRSRSDGN